MARAKTQVERNAFVRGLITEASPLTYPENASLDEKNFVLNRDGSRQRRLGMDYESLNQKIDLNVKRSYAQFSSIDTFRWTNVAGDPNLSFGVVRFEDRLYLFNLFKPVLSTNQINVNQTGTQQSFIDLRSYRGHTDGSTGPYGQDTAYRSAIDFTTIDGKLVCVGKYFLAPIVITWENDVTTTSTPNIDIDFIDLHVRDIWGIYDAKSGGKLAVDERVSTLSNGHLYNLLNQGWKSSASGGDISTFRSSEGVYPSSADIPSFGKKDDGTFDSSLIEASYLGTTPAAKGKFILSAFNRGVDRVAQSGITALNLDYEQGKITTVATYSGRVFYSGVTSDISQPDFETSPNYTGTIFYSKTVENSTDLEKCYQEADPTSEDISELIATDGGTIKIPEAGLITKLLVKDTSLLVFADNGVWQITGPDGIFKATEYSVSKITNIGCISPRSVVNAEGNIFYWSDAGIYLLTADQITGLLVAQNITEQTIQSIYNEIPSVGKEYAVGHFDASGRQITWLFSDEEEYDGVRYRFEYTKELRFDTVLQAFYLYELRRYDDIGQFWNYYGYSEDEALNYWRLGPKIAGYMPTEVFNNTEYQENIEVDSQGQVEVNGQDVIIISVARSRGVSQTKYLTTSYQEQWWNPDDLIKLSFAEYVNSDFKDWGAFDAKAELVTGYELFQDTQRKKGINYLTTHFKRTEQEAINQGGTIIADNPSKCWVQAQWSFADSAESMKFGSEFQAYRLRSSQIPTEAGDYDYGQSVITTKNKLRGNGRALSLKFSTEEGKDCYILGWGLDVDGQTVV
jgi:hypothetical protein